MFNPCLFFQSLKKLLRYISYVCKCKICWSWPKRANVLIFDCSGEELLRKLLPSFSIEVLHIGGGVVNAPVALLSLLLGGKRVDAYIDVYIRKVRPKWVITFIDNNEIFYRVSKRHENLRTIFIQNGWRSYHGDVFGGLESKSHLGREWKVDYMFCFGDVICQYYNKFIEGLAIPVGSLRNNIEASRFNRDPSIIAYVSQWSPDGIFLNGRQYSLEEAFGVVDRFIFKFLTDYACKTNKKLCVIPRTSSDNPSRIQETSYFSRVLGEDCAFFEPTKSQSVYQVIDMAGVVVGVDSTLLYESLSRKNRTAVFSIRGAMLGVHGYEFGWPGDFLSDGLFWTDTPSFDRFREIMDYLFSVSDINLDEDLCAANCEHLMIFDPNNQILAREIKSICNEDT